MTLKSISDKAQTFTFTHDFEDYQTAQVACHAVFGFMHGTYHAPVIKGTVECDGQLILVYAEDEKLNKIFKKICDGFKDYHTHQIQETEIKENYKLKRVQQLKQSESFDSLLEKVVACELELMELADSVLDDDFQDMAVNGIHGNLETVDDEAMQLLKSLDTENDYKALWQYASH